ncbi:hypothetical protein MAR_014331, partial [Mya arenaria]
GRDIYLDILVGRDIYLDILVGRLFTATDGWGREMGEMTTGVVDVAVWCDVNAPLSYSAQVDFGPGIPEEQLEVPLPPGTPFLDDMYIQLLVKVNDNPNRGYLFDVVGSAMTNTLNPGMPCAYGGLIVAYSQAAQEGVLIVRIYAVYGALVEGLLQYPPVFVCSHYSLLYRDKGYEFPPIEIKHNLTSLAECDSACRSYRDCVTFTYDDSSNCGMYNKTDLSLKAFTMRTGCSMLALAVLVATTAAQTAFDPVLTVDSCTKSKLVLTVTGAEDGGIIYIQGQDAACRQTTSSTSSSHEIDFTSCNLQWEESFKVIIQKKALYQTGADKQIPVMCVADLGDLTVSNNITAADKDDDAGQNKTVKPTATMKLFSNGVDVAGTTVKLTDTITMLLELDADYIQDFDIKARDCTADNIEVSQGQLSASFGAFRTTSLAGGSVSMPFSCTLQVCLGSCSATVCTDGQNSYGRKKRQAEDQDNDVDEISVGSSIKITTEEVVIEAPEANDDLCMNQGLFIALIIIMTGGLVATTIAAVMMFRKLQEKAGILSKLSGGQLSHMPMA